MAAWGLPGLAQLGPALLYLLLAWPLPYLVIYNYTIPTLTAVRGPRYTVRGRYRSSVSVTNEARNHAPMPAEKIVWANETMICIGANARLMNGSRC